jgi:hypothetical protein
VIADGETVSSVAAGFGVSRKTVFVALTLQNCRGAPLGSSLWFRPACLRPPRGPTFERAWA